MIIILPHLLFNLYYIKQVSPRDSLKIYFRFTMKKLYLKDFHTTSNARFMPIKDWIIPENYGDLNSELYAAKNSVALLDRSYLGKLRVRGRDAIELINRISTNDLSKLIIGTVCDTIFATPQGRIVDYCRILHLDDELLIISSYMGTGHLIDWINRFIILEDAETLDATDEFIWLTLIGPQSPSFIEDISENPVYFKDEQIWIEKDEHCFPALLNTNFMVPAYNFCFSQNESYDIAVWLKEELDKRQGSMLGDKGFQIMRIESGMPDWRTELTGEYNPHEARLLNAVSFTKGTYTGQEIIACADIFDKVQRYLMIVELNEHPDLKPPLDIYLHDEKIGLLTSYVTDPLIGRHVGLGYVQKRYAVDDLNLIVEISAGQKRVKSSLKLPPGRM